MRRVNRSTICTQVRAGLIPTEAAGKIDPDEADAALAQRLAPRSPPLDPSLAEARRRKELARARLTAMSLKNAPVLFGLVYQVWFSRSVARVISTV
jgi:hypothetical protein